MIKSVLIVSLSLMANFFILKLAVNNQFFLNIKKLVFINPFAWLIIVPVLVMVVVILFGDILFKEKTV